MSNRKIKYCRKIIFATQAPTTKTELVIHSVYHANATLATIERQSRELLGSSFKSKVPELLVCIL